MPITKRRVLVLLLMCAFVVGLGLWSGMTLFTGLAISADADVSAPADQPLPLDLSSGPLPSQLRLLKADGMAEIAFSEIVLHVDKWGAAESVGTIIFDERKINVDDFGDASVKGGPKVVRHAARFERLKSEDPTGENRQLFRVHLQEKLLQARLHLVISPKRISPHRLLIGNEDLSEAAQQAPVAVVGRPGPREFRFAHVLPLNEPRTDRADSVKPWTPDSLQFFTERFTNVTRTAEQSPPDRLPKGTAARQGPRPESIQLGGTLNGKGYLSTNPNFVSYTVFGDVGMSTMVGFGSTPIRLEERKVSDSKGGGRRIFDLISDNSASADGFRSPTIPSGQYSLVLSPDQRGPHFLLIRQEGRVVHVLPLADPGERNFNRQLTRLDGVSADERRAIGGIRSVLGPRFQFGVEDKKVTSISAAGNHDWDIACLFLPGLPHLKQVGISHCRIVTSKGLQVLAHLPNLESVSFYCTPVNDEVLKFLQAPQQLRFLRIYDEVPRGIDPETVLHVTETGLSYLSQQGNLRDLSLDGPGITDAALRQLRELTRLEKLHVHHSRVTLTGLLDLSRDLKNTEIQVGSWTTLHSDGRLSCESDEIRDQDIATLGQYGHLRQLRFQAMGLITNGGLAPLAKLTDLEELHLANGRQLTDDGLVNLSKLGKLTHLSLFHCEGMTDAGFRHLTGLKQLRELNVQQTKVTKEGVAELQKALPECRIQR